MGIMKDSGIVSSLSDFFVSISNETTFPIFTFISAGIVNIFVPSGGGQWAIQGPIIIEACKSNRMFIFKKYNGLSAMGIKLQTCYNPFGALPLLGITGLKKRNSSLYFISLPHWMFNFCRRIVTFLKLKKNNYIYFSHLLHNLFFVLFSNLQKD